MNARTKAISDRNYRRAAEFLFGEAQLLDAGRYMDWLALLTEDVAYSLVAPTISMMRMGAREAEARVALMDETLGTLRTRVRQLTIPAYTIAENPRSFTRRFVTNLMMEPGAEPNSIRVNSNVLIYRSREARSVPHVFSMSRTDELRSKSGGLLLAKRYAMLDEAVVGTRNVATLF